MKPSTFAVRQSCIRRWETLIRAGVAAVTIAAAVLAAAPSPVAAEDYTWAGTNAFWTSSNWVTTTGTTTFPAGSSGTNTAIINSDTVSFAGSDTFGSSVTTSSPVISLGSGGTLASGGFFNTLWNLNLNGGTLLANGGVNSTWPTFQLAGTLTVGGSSASNMSVGDGSNNQVNIGGQENATLTINVADVTSSTAVDLFVGTVLQNAQVSTGAQASGLTKTGAGTLTLSGGGSWTGATEVVSGSLLLNKFSSDSTSSFATSGITVRNGATLGFQTYDNFGNASTTSTPTVTVDTGGKVTSAPGSTLTTILSMTFNGGTLECAGGDSNWGSFNLGAVTVTGSSASAITTTGAANSWFNLQTVGTMFNVADVTGNADADLVVSAAIANGFTSPWTASSLIKTGAGTLTLSGVNTYSGATNVTGGTLVVGSSGALSSAGTINATSGGAMTISGNVSMGANTYFAVGNSPSVTGGTGTVIIDGGFLGIGTNGFLIGGKTLSGNVGIGTFTMTSGTVSVGAGSSSSGGLDATSVWLNPYDAVGTTGTSSLNLNGGVFSTAREIRDGYSGGSRITFSGGTLQAAASIDMLPGSSVSSTQYVRSILINSGGAVVDSGTFSATISNVLAAGSPSGGLTKIGSGTLTLAAANTFSGTTRIGEGVLSITNASGLQSSTVDMNVSDSGTLVFAQSSTLGGLSGSRNLDMGARTLSVGNNNASTVYSGVLSNGSLTKVGSGTLTLAASNSYTGATTVSGGVLALSGTGSIAGSSSLDLSSSGASFDISSASGNRSIGSLSGAAGSAIALGNNSLTAGGSGTTTFGGVIAGSGGFTKTGAGKLSLTSIQGFTGPLSVSAGSLAVSGDNLLADASRIDVLTGATLDATAGGIQITNGQTLGGYGTVSGDLAFASGAILAPGGSVGTLSGTAGTTTWNGGLIYQFEVNNATGTSGVDPGWDLFDTTGGLTLAAGPEIANQIVIDLISLSGTSTGLAASFDASTDHQWRFAVAGSAITTFDASWFRVQTTNFQNTAPGSFSVALGGATSFEGTDNQALYLVYIAVPEPGTLALAGIGLAVFAWRLRRRVGA